MANFNDVLRLTTQLIENDGTYGNPVPDSGYIVAVQGQEFITTELVVSKIAKWIEEKISWLRDSKSFLGRWTDSETYYFDVSFHVENRDEAIRLGRAHSQKAIWDLANKEEITL